MKNNDNQYYIYIRSTKERVPVTKEEFDAYYHDINLFRQKQQYHGKCVCPSKKRLDCDMDCFTCPFYRDKDKWSLDFTITDNDGAETAWIDSLADPTPLIEDIVTDSHALGQLFSRLKELMPQAFEIGALRQQGLTERQIEAEIGVGRKTYAYRLKKVKEILESEFPEFF